MHEELASGKQKTKSENKVNITYFFTFIFVAIGTFSALFVLNRTVESLSLFVVLLAIWGGGLPVGFIGMFIDYRVSKSKFKERDFG